MAITIEYIRQLALSLPNTEETYHWGKTSFRVNGKIYAVIQNDGVSVIIKSTSDEREALTTLEPSIYSVPPNFQQLNYMLIHTEHIGHEEFRSALVRAWCLVAPKRIVKAYNEQS